jgi:4-phytase/acid phosphatase
MAPDIVSGNPMAKKTRTTVLAVLLAPLLVLTAARAETASAGDTLRLAIILSRHGVRSPLETDKVMSAYAAQPWPKWEVPPGFLTPHGSKLMALMGDYYRERLASEHVLSGDAAADGPLVFIRADNDQRTIETARILGKALVSVGEPDVHAQPEGTSDPLFRPIAARVGHPDAELAAASILGRVGGDPRNIDRAYATQLEELRAVLLGSRDATSRSSELDAPTEFTPSPGSRNFVVKVSGRLIAALRCTDSLLLEYADGKPLSEVGWGRVDGRVMTDMLALRDLGFDLAERTLYPAQINGSNLASHIVDTLEQAARGEPIPGALGPSGERVVVLVGHDTNVANIGGLFGMNWCIPGTQLNPTLPGGAIVFELWKSGGRENAYYVRTVYVAQTLDQMREATPLSLENPPAIAPIFIPGCGGAGPNFDAPLASFVRQARRVIDPAFIAVEE